MADINPYVTPSGDYLIQNGVIQNNNSLLSEIYFNLNTPLGSYIYNKKLGNAVLNYQYVLPKLQIIQLLNNALGPLITAGRIKNVQISVSTIATSYSANITCVDNTGSPITFKWMKID